MARKKKSANPTMAAPSGNKGHISTSIDPVDNGFIVNISGETTGKNPTCFSKRMISPTREGALVIASSHLSGGKTKAKKKGGTSKRLSVKKV